MEEKIKEKKKKEDQEGRGRGQKQRFASGNHTKIEKYRGSTSGRVARLQ